MSGSVEGDLAEVKQRLQQNRQSIPAVDDLRQFLKLSREAKLKNPEDVSRYGSLLLKHHKHKLTDDELWQVHEQASIALLEMGDTKAAIPLIKAVLLQFPENSIRARRLQGLYYEAAGAPDQAKQMYEGMLKEQPYNTVLPKRMAALHRGLGELAAAIEVLRQYLDHFSNDREAWEELADCYLEACQYQQAAFCLEEVLSTSPMSPLLLIKYADVLASLGSPSQLKAARAYYSQALRASGGLSVRAMYGIVYVDNQLTDKEAAGSSAGALELPGACARTLLKMYQQQAPGHLTAAAQHVLQKQLQK